MTITTYSERMFGKIGGDGYLSGPSIIRSLIEVRKLDIEVGVAPTHIDLGRVG